METAAVSYKNILTGSNILKPNYHLNYGKKRINQALKKGNKFSPLGEITSQVYTGGIFKRVFVEHKDYGLPYISAQHMMNFNPLESSKIISKKYTPRQEDMTLRNTQILVSCAGTIGNVRLIGNDLDGVIGSQDIIRVISDDKKAPYGFIYAYLSTPTAYNYIQSYIYGSVVPRIEPRTLSKLPIPLIEDQIQQKSHQLIVEATTLRVEANQALDKAHLIFESVIKIKSNIGNSRKYSSRKISTNYNKRLDSAYYLKIDAPNNELGRDEYSSIELGDLVKSKMFTAQRGRRNYVTKGGIKFLSTSNISEKNPLLIEKYLSRKTDGLATLVVKKNWILISSSGQDILGSAFMVDKSYEDCAVNQHSIRVIIDEDKISPFYIYGFLSKKDIKEYIRAGIYGSAVLTINEDFLKRLKIPMLNSELTSVINSHVQNFIECKEQACFKEKEAIDLIEKEIESWQK